VTVHRNWLSINIIRLCTNQRHTIRRNFFSLPLFPVRKDPLILKKSKRKMYSKRYQWLDDAEILMKENLPPWLVINTADNASNHQQAA
jgi:hypothetical protein